VSQRDVSQMQPIVICLEEENTNLMRNPQDYLKISEVPVYKPTNDELINPFFLIRNLKLKGYEKYGAVKIIAPEGWTSEFSFNPAGKLLTTRKQVLKDLIKGKVCNK